MNKLINLMRVQGDMAAGRSSTRMGTVSGYDPGAYCVKVRIQPEDAETGWLPLASPWVGNGWGIFAPPSLGDLVDVHYQEGDFEAGFVCQRFFNDADRPLPCPSGEFWLVHKAGSLLKFLADGSVEMAAPGGLNITGNVAITGTITNNGKNVGSTHTHSGVVPGSGTSGAPV